MSEVVECVAAVKAIPESIHLYCPIIDDGYGPVYCLDEDLPELSGLSGEEEKQRHANIQGFRDRKKLVEHACQMLAFDGADAQAYVEELKAIFKFQLSRCDICIREYHRGRADLKSGLEVEFDQELVDSFMQRFDQMNIDRITTGLDSALDTLRDLPPSERKMTALTSTEMFALLETLQCVPILHEEELLRKHFDDVLRLVQTNKAVYTRHCTPAMTIFLFGVHKERRDWAVKAWTKVKRNLTSLEFEWTVKGALAQAMSRVTITALEKDFMPLFWRGVRMIVERLDQNAITHHLRAMDIDICKLALDHLQVDSPSYSDLLASFRLLLEKAPRDVWDAFGAISPQTVAEQILHNPCVDRLMLTAKDSNAEEVNLVLSWIEPYILSIQAANLPAASRSVLHQLMTRFQESRYSSFAKSRCWLRGLRALVQVLDIMKQSQSLSGAVIIDTLEMVWKHFPPVMNAASQAGHAPGSLAHDCQTLSLTVIERALELDCHSLALDRDSIAYNKSGIRDINLSSLSIWKAAVRGVKPSTMPIAARIMAGTRALLTLDNFTPKQINPTSAATSGPASKPSNPASTMPTAWNNGLDRAQAYIVELLNTLQDYEPERLEEIFAVENGDSGFLALLFSANQQIQQAAATVLKLAASESSRRDSVRKLVDNHFDTLLSAFALNFANMAKARTFSPCLTVLKVGTDLLEALCSSENGLLRSRRLSSKDGSAVESVWQALWQVIAMIFENTEAWSKLGYEKSVLTEFCKDAMDFADQAFDQYSVVSGALQNISDDQTESSILDKRLLAIPREAKIYGFLRLRDEYLISKALSVTCSVMARLKDVEIRLPEEATFFMEEVISGVEKNKLNASQKAELRRALENHLGRTPRSSPEPQVQKPQRQGSLNSWVSGDSTASTIVERGPKPGTIDIGSWNVASERKKERLKEEEAARKKLMEAASPALQMLKAKGFQAGRPAIPAAAKPAQQNQQSADDFRKKRAQEQEEKKKRDLAAIAAAKKGNAGIGDAGSGLAGLGVEGKDHGARGQGVMVSSDEDSDDEGLDAELFGLTAKPSKRKDTVKQDAAGAIGLKAEQRQMPTKIQRQQRSRNDMRARLTPDLSPLHKIILGWDFFHEGDYPPNSEASQFKRVSKSYRHVIEYRDTFQSLLILEAWQGFVKAREEGSSKPFEVKIVNRSNVDAFIELSTSVSPAELRELQISDGDVILFSTSHKPTSTSEAAHCLARVHKIGRKAKQVEVVYRVLPGTALKSTLVPGSVVHGVKVQSITPLEREYSALSGLMYYDLCDQIIKAEPSRLLPYDDRQLEPLIRNYQVNKAQAKAIRSAVDNDSFTLIQGPPGSGKTKTIVAIVGALLSSSLTSQPVGTRIEAPKANGFQGPALAAKKLMVCAPSNAAVDELVMRLKAGVTTIKGQHKSLNIVRLGRSDAVNSAVLDVTMDELVSKRLGPHENDGKAREKTQMIMKEHQKVSEQLRNVREQLDGGEVKGPEHAKLQDELNQLRRRKNDLGTQIDNSKDAEKAAGRNFDLERKRVQQAILNESHVICATLSGSGHDMFHNMDIEFETVVVDEAAQCVELSSLIPLKYGCAKCILVGDPKQLPPTVFSKQAARFQYEQSLFVRMQGNYPEAVHLLDTQYRMHPDISAFPSATFYDGRLLDGDDMAGLRQRPWHKSSLLAPYRFFDVEGQHQSAPKGHSLINKAEVEIAISLYNRLTSDFGDYDLGKKVGIITPYKSQLQYLKERFSQILGSSILDVIEFNTTDAFQGRECEIIIFSCVRASPAGNIGFLQDIRRMNVGLTRAKSSLWVLGNSQSLSRGEFWQKLVEDARARDLYTTGNLKTLLSRPSSDFPAASKGGTHTKNLPSSGSDAAVRKPLPSKVETTHVKSANGTTKSHLSSSRQGEASPALGLGVAYNSVRKETVNPKKESDRMEGVKVKLDDKLAGVRASQPKTAARDAKPVPQLRDQDVEMSDADGSVRSGTATPQEAASVRDLKRPRSETPASGEDGGSVGSRKSNPQLRTAAPLIRKRKAADPFMPTTKQTKKG